MIEIEKIEAAALSSAPAGTLRVEYVSPTDDARDYAFIKPPQSGGLWFVNLHGHGSHGDQLYTREDIRECWLPQFLKFGAGILSPNLRDNAWMSPNAASDLHSLIGYIRREYAAKHFIFFSGSMGGTGNLIYATLHPRDVSAAVSLGAATDLPTFYKWCRERNDGVIKEIADAIEAAYRGSPDDTPEAYNRHSALQNAGKLTMPIFLAHGGADVLIPVSQSRELAEKMQANPHFIYHEIPGGNHDSPCFIDEAKAWTERLIRARNWK